MEIDASVKLNELKSLMQVSQDSANNNISLIADKLNELGIDHIPVISLRSGKQLRDLKLDYVTNLIDDLRTGQQFQANKISLAEKILESTKKIKDSKVYLIKRKSGGFKSFPLDFRQLTSYLKQKINSLQH